MGANPYRIDQNESELGQVMRVRREESVFPSLYPCNQFMRDAGILEDFNSLLSNAGLEHFVSDEPYQYMKLTMSVVQDSDVVLILLTPWFITKFITKLSTCLLMFSA